MFFINCGGKEKEKERKVLSFSVQFEKLIKSAYYITRIKQKAKKRETKQKNGRAN